MSVYLTSALISDFSCSLISVPRWIRPPLSPPASDIWVYVVPDVDPRLLSPGLVMPVGVYLSSALYDLRLPAKPKMEFLNIISATHGPGVGSVSPVLTPTTSPAVSLTTAHRPHHHRVWYPLCPNLKARTRTS